jgi:hypothetical protein
MIDKKNVAYNAFICLSDIMLKLICLTITVHKNPLSIPTIVQFNAITLNNKWGNQNCLATAFLSKYAPVYHLVKSTALL